MQYTFLMFLTLSTSEICSEYEFHLISADDGEQKSSVDQ